MLKNQVFNSLTCPNELKNFDVLLLYDELYIFVKAFDDPSLPSVRRIVKMMKASLILLI